MPRAMAYSGQAIICLASDLSLSAIGRQIKREAAGELSKSKIFLAGPPHRLPQECLTPTSRLIIVAHGVESSRHLVGDRGHWTPEVLAKIIEFWLGNRKIQHITLQMCFGAGNRANHHPHAFADWGVSPDKSFGGELAKRCGLADTIAGVTDEYDNNQYFEAGTDIPMRTGQLIFATVGGRRKQRGDKVVFYPDPTARWNNIVPHRQEFTLA